MNNERALSNGARLTLVAMSLVVGGICTWIECLNSQAGGKLPLTEPARKWRGLPTSEAVWRQLRGVGDRELSAEERGEMEADIRKGQLENRLRVVVLTAGLLQYPLVVVLIVCSSVSVFRCQGWNRAVATATLVIGLVSGWMAMYRGYFGSLGW
jgi:hypothetical protein